jgi:D-3-phosphoglycerate dehydrogenase
VEPEQPSSQGGLAVVVDPGYDNYDLEQAMFAPFGLTVVEPPADGRIALASDALRKATVVLVRETPLNAQTIASMPFCRAIVRYGVGVDHIDLAVATARRIYVANVPDYGVDDVSMHTLALLLANVRRVVWRDNATRNGAWNIARADRMYRLVGKTLGLVGYGRIGQAFHHKVSGLDFGRVLICDPALTRAPAGTELVSIDDLCRESDVISLHCPLVPATRHILNKERLALAKPNCIVLNTSRGPLIEETALIEALREGRLRGAGLDVYEQEPPGKSHPLFALSNVVVSDHTAWYSEQSVEDIQRKAAEEVVRILSGQEPKNWVNRWEGAVASNESPRKEKP